MQRDHVLSVAIETLCTCTAKPHQEHFMLEMQFIWLCAMADFVFVDSLLLIPSTVSVGLGTVGK
eukprot:6151907-Amphidinium_carterae.1